MTSQESGGLQRQFCVEVTSQEIPKSEKIDFRVFHVIVFDEILRNRCGIVARFGFINTEVQAQENTKFINTGGLLTGGGG